MAKLNKLADGDGFEGIRHPAKIRKFNQHNILAQFVNDGANLSLGKMPFRNIFQCRNDIK